MTRLGRDLLGRLLAQPPVFFEQLIVDLMVAMGYGSRRRDVARRIGQSGDGGVDGVIEMDELGLDLVYLQAKRYRPGTPVPVSEVRDFIGALEARHSRKGVMVTTSHFTKAARQIVERVPHRIVLIDNHKLVELMIRHNIGVRVDRSVQFKRVNPDYFAVTAEKVFAGSDSIDLRSLLQAIRRG